MSKWDPIASRCRAWQVSLNSLALALRRGPETRRRPETAGGSSPCRGWMVRAQVPPPRPCPGCVRSTPRGKGLGFVERPPRRDTAGEIGEADPEIAVGVLVNDRNVIHRHGSSVQSQVGLPRTWGLVPPFSFRTPCESGHPELAPGLNRGASDAAPQALDPRFRGGDG